MTKAYDVSVLAKWQVVIPKELRDELQVSPWDNLYCFQRGNSLVLKKKVTVIPLVHFEGKLDSKIDSSQKYLSPLGQDEKKNIYGLSGDDMSGVTYMLGMSGQGKSINALNQIYSDIMAWSSVIVVDPYGNRIEEIKNYVESTPPLHIFEYSVTATSPEQNLVNRQEFLKNITPTEVWQTLILVNLNFKAIGRYQSHILGCKVVHDLFQYTSQSPVALYIDEANSYLDTDNMTTLSGLQDKGIKCVLLDTSLDSYSDNQAIELLKYVRNLICYKVSSLTAKFLVSHLHLNLSVNDLKDMQKYYFYAKIDTWETPTEKILQGIYPIW